MLFYKVVASLAVVVAGWLFFAGTAWAAEFDVTVAQDAVDANPGDGDCLTAANECTLRAAVQEANALGGADTVNLPVGIFNITVGTRGENAAAQGDLDITSEISIVGTDQDSPSVVALDPDIDRAFDVRPGGDADLSRLTITGGDAQQVGGGLINAGNLTITDSEIRGNVTGEIGPINQRRGGGIYNNGGTLRLERVDVVGNTSRGDGGGLYNLGGDVTLVDTTIDGNRAGDDGGGISNDDGGGIALLRSTISNNRAADEGGGIRILDGSGQTEATEFDAFNSTISGNTADDQGGGVWSGTGGVLDLRSSTVADNGALNGSNIFERGQATAFDKTIVADPRTGGNNDGINCVGTVNSRGDNLDDDGSCGFNQASDLNNQEPNLIPLADNGGFTFTHGLGNGSPAIDAVTGAGGGAANQPQSACPPPDEDQRLLDRPQDGNADGRVACDIGAFEVADDNEAPVANDDEGTTGEGEPVNIEVLLNDADPNGDPLTITDVGEPANGTAVLNGDGTITYTPNPGFSGEDTFTYTVSDGRGGVVTATVTVNVAEDPPPPPPPNPRPPRPEPPPRPQPPQIPPRPPAPPVVNPPRPPRPEPRPPRPEPRPPRPEPRPPAVPAECRVRLGEGNVIRGTNGNDVLRGTRGRDLIFARGGNDRILAGGGNDVVIAGSGNDSVEGGGGNDFICGQSGNDRLEGGNGNDRIQDSSGNNRLDGGRGNDVLRGGRLKDQLIGGSGRDRLSGNRGNDLLDARDRRGGDRLDGGPGRDLGRYDDGDRVRNVVNGPGGIAGNRPRPERPERPVPPQFRPR